MRTPLWTQKLSDYQLQNYIKALDEYEMNKAFMNELLKNSANTWYNKNTIEENIACLALDIYKEISNRWLDEKDKDLDNEKEL